MEKITNKDIVFALSVIMCLILSLIFNDTNALIIISWFILLLLFKIFNKKFNNWLEKRPFEKTST